MRLAAGESVGEVAATRGVPDGGHGLVLNRAEMHSRDTTRGDTEAKLREALVLRLKKDEVPGLDPALRTYEFAMDEAGIREPPLAVSSKISWELKGEEEEEDGGAGAGWFRGDRDGGDGT